MSWWPSPIGADGLRRADAMVTAGSASARLTQWERDYLLSLEDLLRRRGAGARLSPPQADCLAEIEAKMATLGLIPTTRPADQPALL